MGVSRKINKIFSICVGIVLCFVLGIVVTHADTVDNVVLLEKRNPGYWDYLSPDAATTRTVPTSFFNGDKSANLLPARWKETTEQGVTALVNDDGSVTVTGTNTGEDFNLTITWFDIPVGNYIYTNDKEGQNFISGSGVWMYVWQENAKDTIHTLPELSISGNENYHTGIHIDKGASDINITFYPMIRLAGDYSEGYKPADFDDTLQIKVYQIESEVITEDDLRIFLNRSTRERNVSVIDLGNGYGIQINNTEITYGSLNNFGFVEDGQPVNDVYELMQDYVS